MAEYIFKVKNIFSKHPLICCAVTSCELYQKLSFILAMICKLPIAIIPCNRDEEIVSENGDCDSPPVPDTLLNLVESLPKRVEDFIAAKGNPTQNVTLWTKTGSISLHSHRNHFNPSHWPKECL